MPKRSKSMRFEVYKDGGGWNFYLFSKAGKCLAVGSGDFPNRAAAKRAIKSIQEFAAEAEVSEV